ncbi:UDP-2-acetamido-2,6-dideoxy-hexulose 4-reductase [Paenibacillus marchantiophytorum]|uniref:UDP-2-acetamido-2,6-dideoxy-hexulose 4-reductase n=1 Tax=Paenibacillus marchantiophytorum TaxID=1619310 RepID=A0ABQ1FC55_9BACL|nr:NAD-dependent epimerase/dehydratase family protein [Paenibacillus marchantiophytorum]GGA05401.1 UDP-2-acetamido-2,6-dideoxy-hexulose 4-reductase [Paenibacillus marchantiophytorum]
MKSILITGANGFTGEHACRHFVQKGLRVAAVTRYKESSVTGVQSCVCDLTQAEQVYALIDEIQPDYVLHLAGKNAVKGSWQEPVLYMETNMMSTLYLLDALRRVPHCRIVVTGSMLSYVPADGEVPSHPYSLSKSFQTWGALGWAHLFKQQLMIARPSNLIGPGPSNGICGLLARASAAVEAGVQSAPFQLSSRVEERDYVDVRDAVAAYALILEEGTPSMVYPVASGRNRTLGTIVDTLKPLINGELLIQSGLLSDYLPPEPIDIQPLLALGWHPAYSFEESLRDALIYFR